MSRFLNRATIILILRVILGSIMRLIARRIRTSGGEKYVVVVVIKFGSNFCDYDYDY